MIITSKFSGGTVQVHSGSGLGSVRFYIAFFVMCCDFMFLYGMEYVKDRHQWDVFFSLLFF